MGRVSTMAQNGAQVAGLVVVAAKT